MQKVSITEIANLGLKNVKFRVTREQHERLAELYKTGTYYNQTECYIYLDVNGYFSYSDSMEGSNYFYNHHYKEIELCDVEFKTQQDIWGYLFNGGSVIYEPDCEIISFHDGRLTRECCFLNCARWKPYIKPIEWYEKTSELVACWVSDVESYPSDENHNHVLFVRYSKNSKKFFTDYPATSWNYATPLTKEELLKFLMPQ